MSLTKAETQEQGKKASGVDPYQSVDSVTEHAADRVHKQLIILFVNFAFTLT